MIFRLSKIITKLKRLKSKQKKRIKMKNWSLSKKIWAIIGILSVAFIFSSVFSVKELIIGRDSLNEITQIHVKRDQLTSEIKDNQRRITQATMENILRTDAASLKRLSRDYNLLLDKQERDMKAFADISSAEGKVLIEKYMTEYRLFMETAKASFALGAQNKNTEAANVLFSADSNLVSMRGYIDEMNKLTATRLAEISKDSNERATRSIVISIFTSTLSIFLSLMIAFLTLRAVTRSIAEVVKNLSDSSMQVSGAATQIASSAEGLSQATTEQAASLEETAASVEEMNSMIAKNSENAKSAEETSGKSQEAVSQGKTIIRRMAEAMEAINKSSEGMVETVKVIEQIDKKTKVINEIVNKTELLSFNASVEAARAGEHGKGFAVVAEEVGNLARMSGAAAEEIATLLEDSISKVNLMVQDTKKNVETGAAVTRECGEVFEVIVQNVTSVSGMATEISSASQEQARGCGEITKAMTQLDQMTQQNASTSEECASAAEELSAQAEALKNAVAHLVSTVNGETAHDHSLPKSHAPASLAPIQKKPVATPVHQNVVQLKAPRTQSSPVKEPSLKKASGETPLYDHDGFKDV
jgi:methyl-accepting chemotaxis protein